MSLGRGPLLTEAGHVRPYVQLLAVLSLPIYPQGEAQPLIAYFTSNNSVVASFWMPAFGLVAMRALHACVRALHACACVLHACAPYVCEACWPAQLLGPTHASTFGHAPSGRAHAHTRTHAHMPTGRARPCARLQRPQTMGPRGAWGRLQGAATWDCWREGWLRWVRARALWPHRHVAATALLPRTV